MGTRLSLSDINKNLYTKDTTREKQVYIPKKIKNGKGNKNNKD